jgi:DOPA 4,5-dioxygenase
MPPCLDIFVHGLSGDALKDHTDYAYWLGHDWPLDLRQFQES